VSSLLLLNSEEGNHARASGYGVLARHLPEAELVEVTRWTPTRFHHRVQGWLGRRRSLSAWHQLSSARLERLAAERLDAGFRGLVHLLWADRDLGHLDRICARAGVPLCGTFHICDDTLPVVLQKPARLRSLAGIILMSASQRPFFEAHGVPPERLHLVLHGVDTDYFSPAPPTSGDRFTVLSVGSYRRDFPLLREVCAAASELHFRIVAPPVAHPIFAGLRHVECLAGLTDEALLGEYRRASCLLMTAENVTANNAVLEALACGLPVVGERIGGLAEYVPDTAGCFAPARDVGGLVSRLRELAATPTTLQELRRGARARAEELAWPVVAERTREVYRRILSAA
jgi:glycosyltransferase involved in cell wall biosynthesis